MKKLIVLLISICILNSCALTVYEANFTQPFTKTYDVKGTQDELFIKANLWMITIFKDARSVIQYSDKSTGVILGKYLLHYYPAYHSQYTDVQEIDIYAVIEIRVKDDKAFISIKPDNFKYLDENKRYNYGQKDAEIDITNLLASFSNSMSATSVNF